MSMKSRSCVRNCRTRGGASWCTVPSRPNRLLCSSRPSPTIEGRESSCRLGLPFAFKKRWTFQFASPIVTDGCTNEIKRTLKQDASIEVIQQLLAGKEYATRSLFADTVCQQFGFVDARQRVQRAGCVKALRELEQAGHFVLPAALHRGGTVKSPRRVDEAVPAAIDVPAQAGDVRGLTLVIVDRLELMRVW